MVSHNSAAMFSGWGTLSSLLLSATTLAAVSILLGSFVFYRQYGHNRNSKSQSLNNELVLITGGCGGIGGQIVEDLARRKARVLVLDIQEPRTETAEGVHFYKVDVNSPQAISEIAKSIRETHGDPTVLINNAGVFCQSTILEIPEERLRQTFDVNVLSQFFIVKEFLPAMIRRNQGHIITMASIASFVAVGEMVDYCCSKASALAFHEGLTQELKHFYAAPNVLTSIVHPLWVDTTMIKGFTDYQSTFRQPVMSSSVVSKRVVKQIADRQGGQIILPSKMSMVSFLRGMPISLQEMVRSDLSNIVSRVRAVRKGSE